MDMMGILSRCPFSTASPSVSDVACQLLTTRPRLRLDLVSRSSSLTVIAYEDIGLATLKLGSTVTALDAARIGLQLAFSLPMSH